MKNRMTVTEDNLQKQSLLSQPFLNLDIHTVPSITTKIYVIETFSQDAGKKQHILGTKDFQGITQNT